ncbi:SusC/RagA family TonB-linked outer membrane protein [Sphingobacterium tabacisoli]|uniref:TonB-dependent receptor-like beta-barrel domain-containing protein n=1 Tax=Sphingobacterium tabacisoli TaxID=2044855 RepID=A0ABW5L876_9SPHI|nr:hypothetical protein [Sphingobacterium tabacisoli]
MYFESKISVSRQKGGSDQFYSAEHSRLENEVDESRKGSYTARNDESSSHESTTTFNYSLARGNHLWHSNAAFNIASTNDSYYSLVAEGFPFDRLDNLLFAAQYQANGRPTGDESTIRRIGYLYSGNYSYDNRFLADLSIKRDGSSQFGSDKRFGTFWSAGLGWNLHNERFLKNIEDINRFKLRSSYGTTGSLNIPAYSSLTRYIYSVSSTYFNELGADLNNLGNRMLTWQQVYKFNIGADIELFNHRLDLRLDWYRSITRDAVTQLTLAPSTGFSQFAENLGKVENVGFEYNIRYKLIDDRKRGNMWSVFVNGATNKDRLLALANRLKATNETLDKNNERQVVPNILLHEGMSQHAIYVVPSVGVDPTTGSEIFRTKDGQESFTWDASDKIAYGIARPTWNGNFGSNLLYRGIEIGVILNYQFGGQLYNQTLVNNVQDVNPRYNVDRRAYDLGWVHPGDLSQFTRIGLNTTPTRATSRFVQDNNLLTLSTLSIGYNFYKSPFVKRLGMRSFQLSAVTNDLFQWSSIDIERGTSNPFYRSFALSLRLGL